MPPRERFCTIDAVVAQVELRLIGNPDIAVIDRRIELAHQRQLPGTFGVIFAGVELHQLMLCSGGIGCQQRAPDPVSHLARHIDIDPECDVDINRALADYELAFDQASEPFKVSGQFFNRERRTKPVQDVLRLIEIRFLARERQSAGDFGDQFIFDRFGKAGADGRVVFDPHRHNRAGARERLFAQGGKIGHHSFSILQARFGQHPQRHRSISNDPKHHVSSDKVGGDEKVIQHKRRC